jgi:hypothetical protein
MEFYKNCAQLDTLLSFLRRINVKAVRTSEAQKTNNLYKPMVLIFPMKTDLENRETLLIILNKDKDKVISLQAEAEGRVELYICSPSGPSWPALG